MFSTEAWIGRLGRLGQVSMCCLSLLAFYPGHSIQAQELGDAQIEQPAQPQPIEKAIDAGPEVWLVTYGPGEIYWQRFGHNGIWIRDPGLGLDHVFNFGFFDFEQEGFLVSFLQGRLMYFSAAQPAQSEFTQYMNENRSIRAQRLALKPEQSLALADYLLNEVQPQNRDYLYDYYRNNCSTRVRDALDLALGGALRNHYSQQAAKQNFRDHTRRLTIADFWLYLGLELGLGSPVDQSITQWDEFFIPGVLADEVARLGNTDSPGQADVVLEDVMIFTSSVDPPPAVVYQWWPRYLLIALGLLVAGYFLKRLVPGVGAVCLAKSWSLFSAIIGLIIVYLWAFTDHEVAGNNLNILLFNPLWILVLLGHRFYTLTARLLVGFGGLALVLTLLPPHQYTADVLAAFLPVNLVAAYVLFREGRLKAEKA